MSNRDSIIDSKLNELDCKRDEIEYELSSLPKFVTNLLIETSAKKLNLRTCTSLSDFYDAFKTIKEQFCYMEEFGKLLDGTSMEISTYKWNGYTYDEWVNDLRLCIRKVSLNEKLATVNDAIKKLNNFYSGFRKEENEFNKLLSTIEGI